MSKTYEARMTMLVQEPAKNRPHRFMATILRLLQGRPRISPRPCIGTAYDLSTVVASYRMLLAR